MGNKVLRARAGRALRSHVSCGSDYFGRHAATPFLFLEGIRRKNVISMRDVFCRYRMVFSFSAPTCWLTKRHGFKATQDILSRSTCRSPNQSASFHISTWSSSTGSNELQISSRYSTPIYASCLGSTRASYDDSTSRGKRMSLYCHSDVWNCAEKAAPVYQVDCWPCSAY